MSIKKKIVFLPYDMDTAIGNNNEGELVFSYNLEDTDHQTGGADVFNGQQSVLWNNVRDAFLDEIKAMYQNLRSTGALSYEKVEQMFEEHQSKWPEAIFNEDAMFKYIDPYVEDGTDYLGMLLGSKAEQRKWWLYNRFRYMDSKFNAGDALSDTITLRPYAVGNISITPYADIYTMVNWDGTYDSKRTARGTTATHICPYQSMNDNVVIIHSASQLASIGDLSPLKLGLCDVSKATRIQSLKVGDSDANYSNPNMRSLTLGNNILLKLIDVRNCVGLGDTSMQGHTQQSVDVSGCSILEECYFDGTKVTSVTLPNGGVLKKLHLPATVTNLTILNQKNITEFVVGGYTNISTLRLENVPTLDTKAILNAVPANTRVRLVGFYWTATDAAEIEALLDKLDTMRGLDEQGGNVDTAQVSGEIHTGSLTGAQIASYNARYPYLRVTADHTSAVLSFYNGATLLDTQTVLDGGDGSYSGTTPTKTQDAQYTYSFSGWSKDSDDNTVDSDALTGVSADRNVYACFTGTLRKYTVTFVRSSTDGGGTLQTISNVDYGTVITAASSYTGATPTTTQGDSTDYPFEGWTPESATVQGDTTFTAKFGSPVEVAEISDSWDTIIANIDNGTYSTVYKVGNYKPLDLGAEGTINMQIVAMDADELASGGYAPLTFIGIELLNTLRSYSYFHYPDSINPPQGWNNCTLRNTLNNDVLALVPAAVRARINTVKKVHGLNNSENVQTSYDKLWIPSLYEITGMTNRENTPPYYSKIYKENDATNRLKKRNGTATPYWMRTGRRDKSEFLYITDSGTASTATSKAFSNSSTGVCLGFCLGLEPETIEDSWETILANENYATDYSIGDTKMIDLGTEGKHLMEIVAFDTDDRADGQGKAGITWISKTLLNTTHRMNPSNSSGAIGTGGNGGWENCEMRTYLKNTIKPLIPATIRNAIVPVTKIQTTVTDGTRVKDGQTTTEDVWIPSNYEIYGATDYESSGAMYTTKFTNADSRTKKHNGSSEDWWLRSAFSSTHFRYVGTGGNSSNANSYSTKGEALGFCTN